MTPVKLIPLALACLALAAAGCGSSSKKSSGGATSTPAPPSTTSTPASGGKAVAVAAKNIKFVPAAVTVKVGQTVRWSNQDPVAHTVTAESGATFDSPLPAGGTFEFTPTKPGKINYRCTIHQNQSGTITVTK
jgi:plastocyanin